MSDPALTVAAVLLSQNASESAVKAEIDRLREENAKLALARFQANLAKPQRESRKKVTANVSQQTAQSVHTVGIMVGSLDATGFLQAVRTAGEYTAWVVKGKNGKGETYFFSAEKGTPNAYPVKRVDSRKAREETIKAIHAYCGFDPRQDFGAQDQAARARAARELNPSRTNGPSLAEIRSAQHSLQGFVGGVVSPLDKTKANLQARAKMMVETIIDLEKAGKMKEALVEKARLQAIQEDFATLP